MIALLLTALAAPGVQTHTAQTLPASEWVVRLPTAPSGVGLTDHTELWIVPLDLGIGGPRLGVERSFDAGDWQLAIRPSVGAKTTLRRASLRVEPLIGWSRGDHRLTAELALDLRFLRQLQLGDEVGHELSVDGLQSHLLLVWDTPHLRAKARLPLMDRDRSLRWGSGSLAFVHTGRRLLAAAGVGLLVGRPVDQYTLDTYAWWFWQPYPEVDLALRF